MLTGEKKYGFTDGQQIGWWGNTYPVFARIVNGTLYAVGKELTPGSADLGKVFKLGREWLKNFFNQVTADGEADAALFVDGPHYSLESEDAASFVTTLELPTGSIKIVLRPSLTGVPATPAPPIMPAAPTAAPTTATPATPAPDLMIPVTTTPTTTTPPPVTTVKGGMADWMMYALVGLGAVVAGLVILLIAKK